MTVDWTRAFPASLGSSVRAVEARLPAADLDGQGLVHETNHGCWPAPTVRGEAVMIPARIHNPNLLDDPAGPRTLEAALVACIYSRHHDGHVRQAAARALLGCGEPFVMPFLVQLLGEYVLEIVVDIAEGVGAAERCPAALVEFAQENPQFMDLTIARAHSYWSTYHRRRYALPQDYPAIQVLSRLRPPHRDT